MINMGGFRRQLPQKMPAMRTENAARVVKPSRQDPTKRWLPTNGTGGARSFPTLAKGIAYSIALAHKQPDKRRSHRQLRAFIVATVRQKAAVYEKKWGRTDSRGKETQMSFAEYCDSMAAPGSWAGKFEAQLLAEALNMRFLIHTSWDEILDLNPEAHDVACLYFGYRCGGHWEFVQDADANRWLQKKRATPPEEVDPASVGNKRLRGAGGVTRSVCLSDFASSKKSKHSPSLCLSEIASVSSKQGKGKGSPSCSTAANSGRKRKVAAQVDHRLSDFASAAGDMSVLLLVVPVSPPRRLKCLGRAIFAKPPTQGPSLKSSASVSIPANKFTPLVPPHRLRITKVTFEKPKNWIVGWTCDYCLGTLPRLPANELRASILKHFQLGCAKAPPGATRADALRKLGLRGKVCPDSCHRRFLRDKIQNEARWKPVVASAKSQGHRPSLVPVKRDFVKAAKKAPMQNQLACSICALLANQ